MKIVLGSDHGGFQLKEEIKFHLEKNGMEIADVGTKTGDSVDYPDIAKALCKEVTGNSCLGILVCGTGIGMSIAANKNNGIVAALVHNAFTAELARRHNNANVLCLGGRVLGKDLALKTVDSFLSNSFDGEKESGERHRRRVDKFIEFEK